MNDFEQIKLVIWDLDNTLWDGVISEGEVSLKPDCVEIIKKTADCGIIHTICSKNDSDLVLPILENAELLDYFVFNSIDWSSKGERIKNQLSAMGLRAQNTLFIDDEPTNLEEATFYNKGLMVLNASDIQELFLWSKTLTITDENHSRLQQYKLLEKKSEIKKSSQSNEAFLYECHIKCEIVRDKAKVLENIDRVSELVSRTNQLNYTKNRVAVIELVDQIKKSDDTGFVRVLDDFGDYGIIGFYVIKEGKFLHFLFSCRILGMGIEQYVYNQVRGNVVCVPVGEVVSELKEDYIPAWINCEKQGNVDTAKATRKIKVDRNHSVLLKGPCDLQTIFSFISSESGIDSEFTYVSSQNGVAIESISHTMHVVQAKKLTEVQRARLAELPFGDKEMYSDMIYRYPYKMVFLSILQDATLGMYRNKKSGEIVVYGQGYYPLTDEANWQGYCEGTLYTAGCKWNRDLLKTFREEYEFAGILTPTETFQNILKIKEQLDYDTKLVLILGTETEWEGNKSPAWKGKNLWYKECNDLIKQYCKTCEAIDYIDVNKYITGQDSFENHYNHYVLKVYYDMTQEIVEKIVNCSSEIRIKSKTSFYLIYRKVKKNLIGLVYRLLKR